MLLYRLLLTVALAAVAAVGQTTTEPEIMLTSVAQEPETTAPGNAQEPVVMLTSFAQEPETTEIPSDSEKPIPMLTSFVQEPETTEIPYDESGIDQKLPVKILAVRGAGGPTTVADKGGLNQEPISTLTSIAQEPETTEIAYV